MRGSELISPFLFTCSSLSLHISLSVLGFSYLLTNTVSFTFPLILFPAFPLTLTHCLSLNLSVVIFFCTFLLNSRWSYYKCSVWTHFYCCALGRRPYDLTFKSAYVQVYSGGIYYSRPFDIMSLSY